MVMAFIIPIYAVTLFIVEKQQNPVVASSANSKDCL